MLQARWLAVILANDTISALLDSVEDYKTPYRTGVCYCSGIGRISRIDCLCGRRIIATGIPKDVQFVRRGPECGSYNIANLVYEYAGVIAEQLSTGKPSSNRFVRSTSIETKVDAAESGVELGLTGWDRAVIVSGVCFNRPTDGGNISPSACVTGVPLQSRHGNKDDGQNQAGDGQDDHNLNDCETAFFFAGGGFTNITLENSLMVDRVDLSPLIV